jgi:surface polysaccharide O-acyltransferase-like enzyme
MERNKLLDILKVVAAIFVICSHCHTFYDQSVFLYQITSNGFLRLAVPFFFTINGYFIFDTFEKKKIYSWSKKVLLMYVVWMIIYSFYWFNIDKIFTISTLKTLITGFSHLWYLIALLMGVIILFILRKLSTSKLIAISLLALTCGLIIQYIGYIFINSENNYLNKIALHSILHRNFLFFAFPMLTAGYLLRRENILTRVNKKTAIRLFILGFILLYLEVYISYYFFSTDFIHNLRFTFIILGPVLFILANKYTFKIKLESKFISQYATLIYLVHPLFIGTFYKAFALTPTYLTLATLFASLILAAILTLLKQRFNLPI